MNVVILTGRLTKSIEQKITTSGYLYTNFSLAVKKKKKEDGPNYIDCTCWGQPVKFLYDYAKKGSLLCVRGSLEKQKYDSDGTTKYITRVIVEAVEILSNPKEQEPEHTPEPQADIDSTLNLDCSINISPDDLPF